MLIQELYDYYGSWVKMGRCLELGVGTYQAWRKNGYIPYSTQLLIEKRSNGIFIADEDHGKPVKKIPGILPKSRFK